MGIGGFLYRVTGFFQRPIQPRLRSSMVNQSLGSLL
jgi:hypothetical protein